MVRNIDHDETPHILKGNGCTAHPIWLGEKPPQWPAPPMHSIEDFADLASREYEDGFDDGYTAGHSDGWAKGRGTTPARHTLGLMVTVLAAIGFGCVLGFAIQSNLHAEPQKVAEVGE